MNELYESHDVKYKIHDDEWRLELKLAFEYLQNNIEDFQIKSDIENPTKNDNFKNDYNLTDEYLKDKITSLVYSENLFSDKDICLYRKLGKKIRKLDGNELYVYIIQNEKFGNYDGYVYLKLNLQNEILSFHNTMKPTLDRNYKYAEEIVLSKSCIIENKLYDKNTKIIII